MACESPDLSRSQVARNIDDRKQAEERMRNENLALREEIDRSSMFEEIVGCSEPLRRVLAQVDESNQDGL
jgi:transcriptional regulator with GAF, ATPase, and Fis domain